MSYEVMDENQAIVRKHVDQLRARHVDVAPGLDLDEQAPSAHQNFGLTPQQSIGLRTTRT